MEGEEIRAVFDTNVLVSPVLALQARKIHSAPLRCIDAALDGRVRLFHSPVLLEELLEVLRRPKIGLSRRQAVSYVSKITRLGRGLKIPGTLRVLQRDPSDNHVLELAVLARADFLVTGNLKHYEELRGEETGGPVFEGAKIVSPADFLRAL